MLEYWNIRYVISCVFVSTSRGRSGECWHRFSGRNVVYADRARLPRLLLLLLPKTLNAKKRILSIFLWLHRSIMHKWDRRPSILQWVMSRNIRIHDVDIPQHTIPDFDSVTGIFRPSPA